MIQLPEGFNAGLLMADYWQFGAALVGIAFIVTSAFVVQRIMSRV